MTGFRKLVVVQAFSLAVLVVVAQQLGCNRGAEKPAASIGATDTSSSPADAESSTSPTTAPAAAQKKPAVDPVVLVRTDAGDIKIQLFAEKAPQTVDNFLRNYVQRGFYAGTLIHHVDPSSMIVAGGFGADLQPKETRAEIFNESANAISNVRGTVAMARDAETPHSATSQFFFNLVDNTSFDYQNTDEEEVFGYCVFGKVIEGMDVVDRIAAAPVAQQGDFSNMPTPAITIQSIERVR